MCILHRGASAMKELINGLRPSYGWLASQLEEEVITPTNYDSIRSMCNNNLSGVADSTLDNLKDISGKLDSSRQCILLL